MVCLFRRSCRQYLARLETFFFWMFRSERGKWEPRILELRSDGVL